MKSDGNMTNSASRQDFYYAATLPHSHNSASSLLGVTPGVEFCATVSFSPLYFPSVENEMEEAEVKYARETILFELSVKSANEEE